MKKTMIALSLAAVVMGAPAMARTWTSVDGQKTFEGDFVSKSGDEVTVKMVNGQEVTFPVSKLSEGDRTFVAEQKEGVKATAKAMNTEQPIYAKMAKYLRKFDKRSYKKTELTTVPDYYIVYFSASW